jgi:hypothetical protein
MLRKARFYLFARTSPFVSPKAFFSRNSVKKRKRVLMSGNNSAWVEIRKGGKKGTRTGKKK